jgi:hypothetical protein
VNLNQPNIAGALTVFAGRRIGHGFARRVVYLADGLAGVVINDAVYLNFAGAPADRTRPYPAITSGLFQLRYPPS